MISNISLISSQINNRNYLLLASMDSPAEDVKQALLEMIEDVDRLIAKESESKETVQNGIE